MPVHISGSLFGNALDTSANRKLRFSPVTVEASEDTVAAAEAPIAAAALEDVNDTPRRSYSFILSTLAAIYLLGTAVTLGHMVWETVDPTAEFADLATQLETLAGALTWPDYWLANFLEF